VILRYLQGVSDVEQLVDLADDMPPALAGLVHAWAALAATRVQAPLIEELMELLTLASQGSDVPLDGAVAEIRGQPQRRRGAAGA
jgi:hypothetical protein